MAQCEDVVRNSTMNAEVVYISDDDEREANPSTSGRNGNNNRQARHPAYNQNVYENTPGIPQSAWVYLKSHRNEKQQRDVRKFQEIQKNDPKDGEIFYVPDEQEEEEILIGPIRERCQLLLFGSDILRGRPKEFSYDVLIEIELHLKELLRTVSSLTETNVWCYVIEQFTLIRMAYQDTIDVCTCYL